MSKPAPIYRFDNLDTSESAFLNQQLQQVRAKSYDIKYPNLIARELIPVDNSVDNGSEVVTYYQYDQVGMAKIIRDYADDLPRADVQAKEFHAKVRSIAVAYGYSVQEIRAAMKAGNPLEQRKANAARKAVEQLVDDIAQLGDSKHGLLGFLNQPNTSTYTPPADGTGASALWSAKSADLILRDMHGAVKAIVVGTKGVEAPDTMLIPLDQYELISTKRIGTTDGSDNTILAHFLRVNPWIKSVVPWIALTGAGAGGTNRMVVYRKDPDALQLVMPQEFEQFPPQTKNLEITTPCHARISGVHVYYPLSICYADGI